MATLAELEERRAYECRLTPDRALRDLDEAAEWVAARGIVTRTEDCSLPSFHTACHEEPYLPHGRGFASWPRTRWWWFGALGERAELLELRIHAGKSVLVTRDVAALIDPLARLAIDSAEGDAATLLQHLADAGPSTVDDLKTELGWPAGRLRAARTPLERRAAIVARGVQREAEESELRRWDQLFPDAPPGGGIEALVEAGVRAAVLARENELRRWFSWRLSDPPAGLERPAPGWVAAPASA